jgi:thiosulfate dehydrogenase
MNQPDTDKILRKARIGVTLISFVLILIVISAVLLLTDSSFLFPTSSINPKSVISTTELSAPTGQPNNIFWTAPDSTTIELEPNADEILFGRNLISRTSEFLGPKGKVMHISNGMNCQNCHLNAGTRPFGNNYSAVASTYPKFRARSGAMETIEKRVNDCIERSLNGRALENDSREMRAIVTYIKWVGKNVPKDTVPKGSGLPQLTYLEHPADPQKGKPLYDSKCVVCHGKNGEGKLNANGTAWTYPPLWGDNSYNIGAGLFRISRFAGYIKANMPLGATFNEPQLTDEEAWHLAAYVNSMARPEKILSKDWPDISLKPFDHPFGPYADGFDEKQHKYGPFKPILDKRKQLSIAAKK